MNWTLVFLSSLIMFSLGGVLALVVALFSKKLFVPENPLVVKVESLLPGANCGGCGEAGCHALAEKIVTGECPPTKCLAVKGEALKQIFECIGKSVEISEKKIARIACSGGNNVAVRYATYNGLHGCKAAQLAPGGGKGCAWGCLGFGDCAEACPFNAININENGLPTVNPALCVGCGVCVSACPKHLISLHSVNDKLWVACNNRDKGADVIPVCAVGCLGCGICSKDAPAGLVEIKNNLPQIDYSRSNEMTKDIIQRCPTGAIGWFDDKGNFEKGEKAKVIDRKEPLPIGQSKV